MSITAYSLRPMERSELATTALEWAQQEGWNPGLHDAEPFYAADPAGFWIGLVDERPVAAISVVRYSTDYGFLGLYLVSPSARGKGYGYRLWQQALKHLDGCVVGLDGVVAQQPNYRTSGFELSHRNLRYALDRAERGRMRLARIAVNSVEETTIVALAGCDGALFETLCRYDRAFFPAPRSAFLQRWIEPPGGHAVATLTGDNITGYGVIRRCHCGYKVGPLFADDGATARRLLMELLAAAEPAEPVYLDIPESNTDAQKLIEALDMTLVFETARMYRGAPPQLAWRRTYGITTFELG